MQGGVGDSMEFFATGSISGLDSDPVRNGHEVPGEQSCIGVRREIPLIQGTLKPVAKAGACDVAQVGRQLAGRPFRGVATRQPWTVGQPPGQSGRVVTRTAP